MKSFELFTACKYMYNYIDIEYIHNSMIYELYYKNEIQRHMEYIIAASCYSICIYIYTNHVQLYRLS